MPFPADDYTPHGYLDTPTHTRNLTPRGVLRSHDAGFRWHFPAHAGLYGGRRETYRAGFRLALDGALGLASYDAARSPYHSRNLLTFDLARGAARARATFFLSGEHALCAAAELEAARRVAVVVEYTRTIAAGGEWGESGLVGRVVDGELVLQGFEDGEAFVLATSVAPADVGVTADTDEAAAWAAGGAPGLPREGFVTVTAARGATVTLYGVLGLAVEQVERLDLTFARGRTLRQAQHRLRTARRTSEAERDRKIAEDDAFWALAPRLEGDWPDHWRRGLVYDLETLRMMVRAPIGIYRHVWDAMQIQAPRVVLAEAAIDALLLGYADARTAQELLLGTLLDAPEPNVPCSREDGSYNMVAADGTACGTAPEWGYPLLVAGWLASLRPDQGWVEQVYPPLAEYLRWWLANRADADGWLHYACSWESGQDDSPRFGDQPLGGGHPVRHVRPVDLHAAMAHGCAVLASFADSLGRADDAALWHSQASALVARTDALWAGQRYADVDARAGGPTDIEDVMLLAPLALGIAPPERADALRLAVERIGAESLTWPMFAWTAVEAALQAGLTDRAALLAADVVDRAYTFWDAPAAHPERTLPGVACEYWPPSGRCGGEGYGWGAFTTHLLLHALLGLTPERERLIVRPNLPPSWRVPGRSYRARLHWRARDLVVAVEPGADGRAAVTVGARRAEVAWGAIAPFPWDDV